MAAVRNSLNCMHVPENPPDALRTTRVAADRVLKHVQLQTILGNGLCVASDRSNWRIRTCNEIELARS